MRYRHYKVYDIWLIFFILEAFSLETFFTFLQHAQLHNVTKRGAMVEASNLQSLDKFYY